MDRAKDIAQINMHIHFVVKLCGKVRLGLKHKLLKIY